MQLKPSVDKSYYGYMLQSFAELPYTPKELKDIWGNKRLNSLPHKISAFIERKTIKEVFKVSNHLYYIIDDKDKTHMLEY